MELVKQKDYGLTALAEEQIPAREDTKDFRNRTEYGPDLIQKAFQKSATLRKLTDEIRYLFLVRVNSVGVISFGIFPWNLC